MFGLFKKRKNDVIKEEQLSDLVLPSDEDILKMMDPKYITYELEHAFDEFYMYKDLMNMPKARYVALLQCEIFVNMPFTKDYLDQWFDEMDKCIDGKMYQKAHALMYDIKIRRQIMYKADNFYELLANFFVLKDEDPSEYNELLLKTKIEILKKKNSLFNILLTICFERWKSLPQDSITSLLEYLAKVKELEIQINQESTILRRASEQSLTNLTLPKI